MMFVATEYRRALILLTCVSFWFSNTEATVFNFTQCATDATSTYWNTPNSSFLYDRNGFPTNNQSLAWGISYESCTRLCQSPMDVVDWNNFSQSFVSWLLPWLLLTAQLPFETIDWQGDFLVLLLALGNPALITYSLVLTILNARTINRMFREIIKDRTALHQPQLLNAIKAARAILIESQHIPIQIYNGHTRVFAQLVVTPENWQWWRSLTVEIQKNKRDWTYSLFAQLALAFISQLFTVIDFFTTAASDPTISVGLAINSLFLWMIPVIVGWVYVGTQRSARSIRDAISSISIPLLEQEKNMQGRSFGIRDRTTFYHFRSDNEREDPYVLENPPLQHSKESREEVQTSRLGQQKDNNDDRTNSIFTCDTLNVTSQSLPPLHFSTSDQSYQLRSDKVQNVQKHELTPYHVSSCCINASKTNDSEQESEYLVEAQTFSKGHPISHLGFSIEGCEQEPGPINTHARFCTHMNAVEHVGTAFKCLIERQKNKERVDGGTWDENPDNWKDNLRESSEMVAKYISPEHKDEPNLAVHASHLQTQYPVGNCVTAAIIALILQWSSTGSAIIIAYQ